MIAYASSRPPTKVSHQEETYIVVFSLISEASDLQLSFVIEAADRIWLELTDYGFGQESLWINIRRSKHGSRVVASTP